MVTGNLGYLGSVLVDELLCNNYSVVGYDVGYFKDCNLISCANTIKQIYKDVRDINVKDLNGVDAVIHLAGLSNDPLGELLPGVTEDINYLGALRVAECAKAAGVQRFVYASSQSMYGVSESIDLLDEYESIKNPVTAYAKTKWDAEVGLNKLNSQEFSVVSFRPSTIFGASPRLRTDIVFNNLVACAYTTGKIEIKSDGTPWRPVIHVKDVCAALIAGLRATNKLVAGRAFNIGIQGGNYTVRELAEAAQKAVPGCDLIFTGEHGNDSRTYKVSFERINTELGEYFKPVWDLDMGARELVTFFDNVNFSEADFRGWKTVRLNKLMKLISDKVINSNMRYL